MSGVNESVFLSDSVRVQKIEQIMVSEDGTFSVALNGIIRIFRNLLDIFLHFTFSIMYSCKKEQLPAINDFLLLTPAMSLATKIRKKQLKSVDLVKAYISRIQEVQPFINAVVEQRSELALKEAIEVDKLISSGIKTEKELSKETPFLGVPFTNKIQLAVKGQLYSVGLLSRKEVRAEKDARCVQLMKSAGGIPLSVTNVSELCMWWESYNYLYGRTNNPYDSNRISGGSSGGEGSLISSAGSVIGIGSDIAGNARMPAFFNGIYCHKPTTGIVSNEGLYPTAEKELDTFLGIGPMCRYATDLLPMLKVLSESNATKLKLDKKVRLDSLNVYYMEDDGGCPFITKVDSDMKKALHKVLSHFKNAYKIKPQKLNIRNMKYAFQIWITKMNSTGAPAFCAEMAERKGEVNCPIQLLEWTIAKSKFTLPTIMLGIAEKIIPSGGLESEKYQNMCSDLRREFQSYLGDNGIFFYPSHPEPAPHHNEPLFKPFNFAYTAIFNVLGFPATQCPLGLSKEGLPIGIQVVSNFYNDHLSLAVAVELEKAFGGWICPCVV